MCFNTILRLIRDILSLWEMIRYEIIKYYVIYNVWNELQAGKTEQAPACHGNSRHLPRHSNSRALHATATARPCMPQQQQAPEYQGDSRHLSTWHSNSRPLHATAAACCPLYRLYWSFAKDILLWYIHKIRQAESNYIVENKITKVNLIGKLTFQNMHRLTLMTTF